MLLWLDRILEGGRRPIKVGEECVFLSGCDSGIGLCLAKHLSALGCVVFAGVKDLASPGATELAILQRVTTLRLDVTDPESLATCERTIHQAITKRGLELSAVVNNAGVMVFGEFHWQTQDQITNQFNVNVLGYMRVAQAFGPLLRKFNGRLINVSSHCATVPLPCLSVYSATKAAVEAWSSALALEMHKFNVQVITIHPGSYVRESGILQNQSQYAEEMWKNMSTELKDISSDYFQPMMKYMSCVSRPGPITDPALHAVLDSAIFSRYPRRLYVNSPWRYAFYYRLIALASPFPSIRRRLILSFISLPKYK